VSRALDVWSYRTGPRVYGGSAACWQADSTMADIGRPEREIEVRPAELPLPRELPLEPPLPGPAEPQPAKEPVPA
jgi:hypothetical protein